MVGKLKKMKEKKKGEREEGKEGQRKKEGRKEGRREGGVGSTSLFLFPVANRDLSSLSSPPKDFSILHLFCC